MSSTPDRPNAASEDERAKRSSLPSRNGDATHTLLEDQLAGMSNLLMEMEPGCTSTALNLLREHFPDTPLDVRIRACTIFTERLRP